MAATQDLGLSRELRLGEGWRAASAPSDPAESWWSHWSRTVDLWTISACLVLFAIGVVLAFAASPALAERNALEPFHYAWRHMIFGAPAFALLLACSALDAVTARRVGVVGLGLAIIAMALLPWHGVDHGKGALRWFSIGGASVQPSEFLKPVFVITCAWLLSALTRAEPRAATAAAAAAAAALALAVGLLAAQPDYGQAALLAAVWGAMFFVAGGSLAVLVMVGAATATVGVVAYYVEPHIAARVNAYLDPIGSAQGQVQSAERAILNGGWLGRGLGEGVAKTTLPDAHADFILAVAIEEYGFALALVVILLCSAVTLRGLWRAQRLDDSFTYIAGVGLSLLFGLQAFVHIAVSAQLAPTTGMTLPFVSYGGSSMLAMGATVGLMLALTRGARD